jgi:Domain of unknown function (DUF4864)
MRRVLWRSLAVICCLWSLAMTPAAQAADIGVAQSKQMRAVVQAQLAAFAADDAKRAFSFAAPAIRKMFGTPENFIAMVRTSYPVVYRPASVSFLKPVVVDGRFVQAVQLTDAEGGVWLALYQMQRQKNGRWLVEGVHLVESDARMA